MSVKRDKNLKKYRLKKAWPSIVFFILSANLALIAAVVSAGMMVVYIMHDRMDQASQSLEPIYAQVAAQNDDDNAKKMITAVRALYRYPAAYVIDSKGETLAGYGEDSFNSPSQPVIDDIISSSDMGDFGYITDSKLPLFFDDDGNAEGNINFSFKWLAGNYVDEADKADGNAADENIVGVNEAVNSVFGRKKSVIMEAPFWVCRAISDDRILLIKQGLNIYDTDIIMSGVSAGISLALMCIPLIFLLCNIVTRVKNQLRMAKLLEMDPVTGGKSWLYFERTGERLLCSGRRYAIVDVSVQKYRSYCSCHGIDAGENLLESIDKCLSASLERGEISAHYGHSRFAVMLRYNDNASVQRRLDGMLKKLTDAPEHKGVPFHMGVYLIAPTAAKSKKTSSDDVAEYYNSACAARAAIEDESISQIAFFNQALLEQQVWEHKVADRMQEALDKEEFCVYLQPKYNPANDEIAGAEALVRWISPTEGFIPPGKFVPIFESNGFITKLDDYMISHVAKLQAQWLAEGKKVVPVSVNVSRAHFSNPDLAEHICALVDKYSLPHELLEIELTESAFFDDRNIMLNTVRQLQNMGFEVSMDDFGSGYSSLNSLKDLPLNVLKLDAGFFRGEQDKERGEIVVSQAIRLAKQLNM